MGQMLSWWEQNQFTLAKKLAQNIQMLLFS